MLSYAETTSIRTIVPVTPLPQDPYDQESTGAVSSSLPCVIKPTNTRGAQQEHHVPYPNALRAQMGYTFREVSQESGIPESTLYSWAAGRHPIPHDARHPLAHLLGCSVEELAPTRRVLILEQAQALIAPSPLSALLEHPEFQRGLAEADEAFLEAYEPAPLTEEEMVEEIEMNIGRWVTERTKILDRVYGYPPSSYLCNLGVVVGIINKGLTYA